MRKKTLAFNHGYDRGNYAAAYETEDFDQCIKHTPLSAWPTSSSPGAHRSDDAYREGMLLGFFSSYELYEVPTNRRDEVKRLRIAYGEEL